MMFSKSVDSETIECESTDYWCKRSIRIWPLFVNDFNLCDKDSFGYCLQCQHSIYTVIIVIP